MRRGPGPRAGPVVRAGHEHDLGPRLRPGGSCPIISRQTCADQVGWSSLRARFFASRAITSACRRGRSFRRRSPSSSLIVAISAETASRRSIRPRISSSIAIDLRARCREPSADRSSVTVRLVLVPHWTAASYGSAVQQNLRPPAGVSARKRDKKEAATKRCRQIDPLLWPVVMVLLRQPLRLTKSVHHVNMGYNFSLVGSSGTALDAPNARRC